MPRKRRHRGEDSTYRVCHARYGCPEPEDVGGPEPEDVGGPRRLRPDHSKSCKAPWAYAIDEGVVAGKRQRRVVTARSKAELLAKVTALKEKRALGVTPTAQTVGDWLDYWVQRIAPETIRESTLKGYRSKIRLYLQPALGRVKLQDLTAEHVEHMVDWMRTLDKSRLGHGTGPLSDSTVRQAHMILRSALQDALQRRRVTYNAAAVVRAPKAADNPHEHLGLDDAKAMLKAATSERDLCRLVVALALGIRQGEALGLRWDDYRVTPTGASLIVEEAVARGIDGRLKRTDVKSPASHRLIPIPERMVPIFEAWRTAATDAYMFPGPNGGPADSKRDWYDWSDALTRAGVRHVPLHGARRSAASLLADMDVPDWRIAEILGHGQVTTTRRHYIEGTTESHRQALSGLIGELLP